MPAVTPEVTYISATDRWPSGYDERREWLSGRCPEGHLRAVVLGLSECELELIMEVIRASSRHGILLPDDADPEMDCFGWKDVMVGSFPAAWHLYSDIHQGVI